MKSEMNTAVKNLNLLVDFLAKRDLPNLTQKALQEKCGIKQADLLVLFGGCILEGCEVFYQAYKNNFAENYMITGGVGHTTGTLRRKMQPLLPGCDVTYKSEAEIMAVYLKRKYDTGNIILETKSTNCGNNVINTLEMLKRLNINVKSIVFIQDAAMQLRMEAGFRKYAGKDVDLINFAGYKAYFTIKNNELSIEDNDLRGMWDKDKYIELLMGEIPRLRDDAEGYGPNGKNFIAHVNIPVKVQEAFEYLRHYLNIRTRKADELFATK